MQITLDDVRRWEHEYPSDRFNHACTVCGYEFDYEDGIEALCLPKINKYFSGYVAGRQIESMQKCVDANAILFNELQQELSRLKAELEKLNQ